MTAHPRRPAGQSAPSEVNRAAIFTTVDAAEPSPEPLTLLKRIVNQYDLLEVSNNSVWVSSVASLTDPRHRAMFIVSRYDRIRYRHMVYGYQTSNLAELNVILTDALAPSDPVVITDGAVTVWLSNNTVGVVSSVPDVINPGSPAIQTVGSFQPTGAADFSITWANDHLLLPITASSNQLVTWGWAGWISLGDLTANKTLARYGVGNVAFPGATDSHQFTAASTEAMTFDACLDATGLNMRRATTAISLLSATPAFVTVEFNGNHAAEANRLVITLNGVVLSLTFTQQMGVATAMPAALQGAATLILLKTSRTNGTGAFTGRSSKNEYIFGAAMAGVTQGLLTPDARTSLMNLEPLT